METRQESRLHLKKITLELSLAAEELDAAKHGAHGHQLVFIYGVGSSGLTPLEFKLADLALGDTVVVPLERAQWNAFLGHLFFPWPAPLADSPHCWLSMEISAVEAADPAEIVQALAHVTACGAGCCGDH